MKISKLFSLSLICLFSIQQIANAQNLSFSNAAPVAGDTLNYQRADYLLTCTNGSSDVFNYSELKTNGAVYSKIYMPLNSTGSYSAFSNSSLSTVAMRVSTAHPSLFSFFKCDTNAIYQVSTSNFILPNSGPYNNLVLKFPVTLGKTEAYSYSHHNSSNATSYQGSIKITPDAIGTLITPFATYTNAYRIHRQTNSSNCLTSLGCHWYSTITETFEWYTPGVHGALLSVSSSTTSHRAHGGMPVEYSYSKSCEVYRDPSHPLGTNTYYEDPYMLHFQNPVSDKLEIKICSSDINETKIDIYDINGKILISKEDLNNNYYFDVSNFETGIYIVQLTINNSILERKKLIVRR